MRIKPDAYERRKQKAAARNRAIALAGREIAPLPPVKDAARKQACELDFKRFCETYFSETFTLPWSPAHLRIIEKIQQAVLEGGLFAVATPRGFGKTTLCEIACIWAVLYGHRDFVCLIGADENHAASMLSSIKIELEANDRLLEDFPEAVYPIHKLEGIHNRCAGQLFQGKRTYIVWTSKEIVLPTIPGSKASGAVIKTTGITGSFRGMKHKKPDGSTIRPSLVVIDDPQTDESAKSASQCAAREAILSGAVLGLAGPGKKISGILPCTVIYPGDLADTILDRQKHPEWNGERIKMLTSFPKNMKLWEEYAEIRAESLRNGSDGAEATEFYRKHQAEMDAGAEVSWPERHNPDEISGIQHAMNLYFRDQYAFFAEYQNEPLRDSREDEEELTADAILNKLNNLRKNEVPASCTHLTAFIDVQQNLLFYMVVAWEENFTGYVIDYGTFPEQPRSYFTLRDANPTLVAATRINSVEGAIYAGLDALTKKLLGREYQRDDGALLRIEKCLIDAQWGLSTDLIYKFCRQSAYSAILLPSHGKFIGASSKPLNAYKKQPGDIVGLNWRIPKTNSRNEVRHVVYDSNFWKSFVCARLKVPFGERGCLSIYGKKASVHKLLAAHLTAEYRIRVEANGRIVDEWKQRPTKEDNHWFDCLAGCAVAASIVGVRLPELESGNQGQQQTRKRISFAELQRQKRR